MQVSDIIVLFCIGLLLIAANLYFKKYLSTRQDLSIERRRFFVNIFSNISFAVFFVFCITSFLYELKNAALSLAAVSAAIAVTFKELVLSVLGTIYLFTMKPYDSGDHIEINGIQGEVISSNWLSTVVFQTTPSKTSSGRSATFPHSWLLTNSLLNTTHAGEWLYSYTSVYCKQSDALKAKSVLLEATNLTVAPFKEEASFSLKNLGSSNFTEMPNTNPIVSIQLIERDEAKLTVRYPCHRNKQGSIESLIIDRYLLLLKACV